MATFRLDRSTDAAGTSERIVDDHGVIALVKARGKMVGAGNMLAASPDLLEALRLYAVLGSGKCSIGKPQVEMALAAIAKAEGR